MVTESVRRVGLHASYGGELAYMLAMVRVRIAAMYTIMTIDDGHVG